MLIGVVMTNKNSGFTLIEFLVAIVILMVGMLGLLQVINVAMDQNLNNIFRNEAVMLADDMMMKNRARAFVSISTGTQQGYEQRNVRGIMKNYSVTRVVTDRTGNSKEIAIDVRWKKKNAAYSHSVNSVISTY